MTVLQDLRCRQNVTFKFFQPLHLRSHEILNIKCQMRLRMPSYFILQTGEAWIIRIRLFYLVDFGHEWLQLLFQKRRSFVPNPPLGEVLNKTVINKDLMSTILIEESFTICIITFVVRYVELFASLDVSISVSRKIFISVGGSGLDVSPVAVL